jgi:hypothetical protein
MPNQQDLGIDKQVTEAVYPGDILADQELGKCDVDAWGVWFKCLLPMWRDRTASVTGTIESLARLWGCTPRKARRAIEQFKEHKPCDVTQCHDRITLTCRRLARREKVRKQGAKRQQKFRESQSNGPVTEEKGLSSSSLSSSSSDTPKGVSNTEGAKAPSPRFQPPTREEVIEYAKSIDFPSINPDAFIDHYEANGWMRGNTKIKSWKACVRTWKHGAGSGKTKAKKTIRVRKELMG